MKKYSITTKKGDDGTTGLLDQSRVLKYDIRPDTYGTLDEAAAFLGWARVKSQLQTSKDILRTIQNHLYLINSELACPPDYLPMLKDKLKSAHLQKLERLSDAIETELELPRKFVLYGESEVSAVLDVARAVIRRAERRMVELNEREPLENQVLLAYINRLSDTLFLLARYEEYKHEIPYAHPESTV